jgi:hypothetical protein
MLIVGYIQMHLVSIKRIVCGQVIEIFYLEYNWHLLYTQRGTDFHTKKILKTNESFECVE